MARPEKFAKSPTVRDAWMRDLYALRGALAHGKIDPKVKSVWTIQEHLLLASYVFPLVMKAQLAKVGLYKITEKDKLETDVFEPLAGAVDLFAPIDADCTQWPWHAIVCNVAHEARKAQMVDMLKQMDKAQQQGSG